MSSRYSYSESDQRTRTDAKKEKEERKRKFGECSTSNSSGRSRIRSSSDQRNLFSHSLVFVRRGLVISFLSFSFHASLTSCYQCFYYSLLSSERRRSIFSRFKVIYFCRMLSVFLLILLLLLKTTFSLGEFSFYSFIPLIHPRFLAFVTFINQKESVWLRVD